MTGHLTNTVPGGRRPTVSQHFPFLRLQFPLSWHCIFVAWVPEFVFAIQQGAIQHSIGTAFPQLFSLSQHCFPPAFFSFSALLSPVFFSLSALLSPSFLPSLSTAFLQLSPLSQHCFFPPASLFSATAFPQLFNSPCAVMSQTQTCTNCRHF